MSAAVPARVARPELAARLREALERGHLVLVASAGAGKTLTLEEALAGRARGAAAWHRCRALDADPLRLVTAIATAVSRALPGAADALAAPAGDPVVAVAALAADLDVLLVEPLVLVLDDAEALADAPEALAVVDELLRAPGEHLRVALCTRWPLGLRVAKLAASGGLTQIGEADLAFSATECAELLAGRLGREPTAAEIEEAMARTLGWPLGLALGAEAGARGKPAEALAQFLDEEIFGAVEPVLAQQLLSSSLAPRLAPAVVVALGLPEDLPERAQRHGLPLRRSGDEAGWHPLVREALGQLWRRDRPAAERAGLLRRAAAALLDDGQRLEAVELWLEAGDWDAVLDALAPDAYGLARSAPVTLRRWLDLVPEDRRDDPRALLLRGEMLMTDGHYPEAWPALRQATVGLRDSGRGDLALLALGELCEASFWASGGDEILRVQDLLGPPEQLAPGPWAAGACTFVGLARANSERPQDAEALLAARREIDPPEVFAALEAFVGCNLDLPRGGHREALARYAGAASTAEAVMRQEETHAQMAWLHCELGEWDESLVLCNRLFDELRRTGSHSHMVEGCSGLKAWTLARAGRVGEVEDALAPARGGVLWNGAWENGPRAIVAGARGKHREAVALARRAIEGGEGQTLVWQTILAIGMVPVLEAAGDAAGARELLAAERAKVERIRGPEYGRWHLAQLAVLGAWLTLHDGAAQEAGSALAGALDEVGEQAPDLVRALWPQVQELAQDATVAAAVGAQRLVAAVTAAFPGRPEVLSLAEHPSAAVRAEVAAAAAASGHPAARAALEALAADPDADVAARAAAAGAEGAGGGPALAREFDLLGRFALRRGGWEVDERAWGRPTVPRLVRFLLVHRGAPVAEDMILEALWPENPARSALQVAVSRARRILDAPGTAAGDSAIRFAAGTYRLELDDADVVDAERFVRAARAALDGGSRAALERAAALWGGEPLPEERYAPWTAAWREDLLAVHREVLFALAGALRAEGDEGAVAGVARRLVALDPLDEAAHRVLMAAYARTGRRALALRQFLACRRELVDGVGIEPSEETVALQRLVLAGGAV